MEDNPYRSPQEVGGSADRPRRSSRVRQLMVAAIIGAALGSVAIAPFIKHPGGPVDPTGAETAFYHGAAYGGILAVVAQALYLLVKDLGNS